MIKRIFKVVMVPSLIAFVFWSGGFDFNQRNPWIAYGVVVCLFVMWLAWDISGDD